MSNHSYFLILGHGRHRLLKPHAWTRPHLDMGSPFIYHFPSLLLSLGGCHTPHAINVLLESSRKLIVTFFFFSQLPFVIHYKISDELLRPTTLEVYHKIVFCFFGTSLYTPRGKEQLRGPERNTFNVGNYIILWDACNQLSSHMERGIVFAD